MKYRIRNIETDEIIKDDRLYLSQSGRVMRTGYRGSFLCLKAEMKVANGVYVGDYLLIYTDRSPLIAQVVMRDGLPALSAFRVRAVPVILPINLILTNEREVIQCR